MLFLKHKRSPDAKLQATCVTVPPIGPDELPPPYDPSPDGVSTISCKVCGFMIDISAGKDQHVIKCTNCNEATPIKSAPPGEMYVRCPCNCLVICKSSSQRIACPRNDCKKILNLASAPTDPFPPNVPGMCQISCAYCHSLFLFNTLTNALARCPYCRKVSSVGPQFSKRRGTIHLIVGLLILLFGLGEMIGKYSYAHTFEGIYCISVVTFIISLLFFCKAIYYFSMKASSIEEPV